MRVKTFKRVSAALLTLVLLAGLMPAAAFAADPVENTAPAVEDFATVDELRTEFDMDDSTDKTFKKVYFGNNTWQWSIVGVDPVGGGLVLLFQITLEEGCFSSSTDIKEYDTIWGIEYEDGFVPEEVAPNNYGASDMRMVLQSYTESGNNACRFTDAQLDMIIPTTIYTADYYNADNEGNPRIYHSTELLYPTYSTDYQPSPDRVQFVTVGSNSAEELGTELKVSLKENVSSSYTRSPYNGGSHTYVLLNTGNGVDQCPAYVGSRGYLPVFQLDTSNVLFGSIYQGVTKEGEQKDIYGSNVYTLRIKANDLGEAYVTEPAMEYVTVNNASDGTFLVAQCGEGAWAKAVSGDMTFSASDISDGEITTFENCKVWLEKTDADAMLTYASYADTVSAYSVGVTGNTKLVRDENSGAENQVSLDNAPITDIVYSTVEDYYFPEDYCNSLNNNGITVTRNSDTQITISGTPTADVYINLPIPGYCGTKDQWDGVTVASSYESGDGTESSPYVIANAEQFAYFAQQMTAGIGVDACYELTADLEMTAANWKTIPVFEGHFDGNGHTVIYTLKDTIESNFSYYGLFGKVYGTISNLKVSGDIQLSSTRMRQYVYIGGLCGYLGGTVTHCDSDVEIRCGADSIVMRPKIGGLAGVLDGGVVEYSSYSGSVHWDAPAANNGDVIAGGIVGEICDGAVRQCFNRGSLTVNCHTTAYVGGIVGRIYTWNTSVTTTIDNSYNMGSVSSACINNKAYAGGISGYLDAYFKGTGSSVSGCYSTGTLASSTGDVSHLSPVVNEFELKDIYCLEGEDANVQKAEDKAELFEKLNAYAPNTWFADSQTGDVRLLWELAVPAEPNAVFNADGEDSGILSGVAAGMKYSLDGGATWMDITDTTVSLSGVTPENGIQVYLPGDFHETSDSPVQTIAVTKAAVPDTVSAKDCTTSSQNDGMITGVDDKMEYKAEDGDAWIAVTGEEVTGLKPGIYLVRVKAEGTELASASATVTVQTHVCAEQGDWQYDGNGHWKICSCGERLDEAAHSFEWVVDKEATATAAGSKHEECTVCGYAKEAVDIPATGTTDDPSDENGKPSTETPSKPSDQSGKPSTGTPADTDISTGDNQTDDAAAPGTGDDSDLVFWIIAVLAAGIVLYNQKRNHSK